MSELNERRWAVMSARGREALGLTYAEALELGRALKGSGVGGLCVVTDAAGRRLPPAGKGDGAKPSAATEGGKRRRAKARSKA